MRGFAGDSNACYIGSIWTQGCDPDTCFIAGVDTNNKLGTNTVSGPGVRIKDVADDHKKVADLEATVAALAVELKEQAAQIQKVSAQLK